MAVVRAMQHIPKGTEVINELDILFVCSHWLVFRSVEVLFHRIIIKNTTLDVLLNYKNKK